MKKEERFKKIMEEVTTEQLIDMVKDCISYDGSFDDLDVWEFDEEFFEVFFNNKNAMEICRATVFGNVSWCDDYIHFNAYGNLESMSKYDFEQSVEDQRDEIIEHFIELYEENNVDIYDNDLKELIDEYINEEEEEE